MRNLRVIYDNAADRANLSAAPTVANMGYANLTADDKFKVCRSTGKTMQVQATWPASETVSAVVFPFSNLSPTATMRVRVSNELAMTNLATYSEDFGNTTGWPRALMNAPAINVTAAPSGANTADRIIPTTASGSHYLDKSISSLPDNTVYSGSVFLKRDTLWRAILALTAKDGSGTTLEVNFEDGRLSRMSNGTGQNCEFKIWDIGNGWYRIGIEKWNTMSGATVPRFRLFASQHNEISMNGWSNAAVTTARVAGATSPYPNWPVDSMVEASDATSTGRYTSATIYTEAGRTVIVEQTMKALGAGSTRYGTMLFTAGSGLAATRGATINLSTGLITTKTEGTECVFSVENMGNGFWKLKCEFTPNLTGSVMWQVRMQTTSGNLAQNYAGDGVSGIQVCRPYAYTKIQVNNWAPFSGGSENTVVGDGTTGFFAWGAQLELGDRVTSYYPTTTTTQTRVYGYMDAWQSYDYDSGKVLACPAPATKIKGWTAVQAASAYGYGGGSCARMWLPSARQATGVRVDIEDLNNVQGYAEVSRLIIGDYWEANQGVEVGATVTLVDSAKHTRTEAGNLITDAGYRFRKQSLPMPYLDANDRQMLWNILVNNGLANPVFISLYPGDTNVGLEKMHEMYGKLVQSPIMTTPYFNASSATLEIEEV